MLARAPLRLACLVTLLLLASCWTGPLFYSSAELKAPIPLGDYRQEPFGKPGDSSSTEIEERPIRVSVQPDGLTRMEPLDKPDDAATYGFAALDGGNDSFVGWMAQGEDKTAGGDMAYFLLEKGATAYRFYLPVCKDEGKDIALAAGATFSPDPKVPSCKFADRKSLETALRRLGEISTGGVRLVPIAPQTAR